MSESEKREQAEFEYYLGDWQDELKKRGLKFFSRGSVKEEGKELYSVTVQALSGVRQFTGKGEDWNKAFGDAVMKFDVRAAGRIQESIKGGQESTRQAAYAEVKQAASSGNFWGIESEQLQLFIDNIKDQDFELAAMVAKELERRKK